MLVNQVGQKNPIMPTDRFRWRQMSRLVVLCIHPTWTLQHLGVEKPPELQVLGTLPK